MLINKIQKKMFRSFCPDTLKKKKTKRNNKDLDIVKKNYG